METQQSPHFRFFCSTFPTHSDHKDLPHHLSTSVTSHHNPLLCCHSQSTVREGISCRDSRPLSSNTQLPSFMHFLAQHVQDHVATQSHLCQLPNLQEKRDLVTKPMQPGDVQRVAHIAFTRATRRHTFVFRPSFAFTLPPWTLGAAHFPFVPQIKSMTSIFSASSLFREAPKRFSTRNMFAVASRISHKDTSHSRITTLVARSLSIRSLTRRELALLRIGDQTRLGKAKIKSEWNSLNRTRDSFSDQLVVNVTVKIQKPRPRHGTSSTYCSPVNYLSLKTEATTGFGRSASRGLLDI